MNKINHSRIFNVAIANDYANAVGCQLMFAKQTIRLTLPGLDINLCRQVYLHALPPCKKTWQGCLWCLTQTLNYMIVLSKKSVVFCKIHIANFLEFKTSKITTNRIIKIIRAFAINKLIIVPINMVLLRMFSMEL